MREVREPRLRPRTLAFWRAVAAGRTTLTAREDAEVWRLRAAGHSWNWITEGLLARRAEQRKHLDRRPSVLARAARHASA